MVGPLQVVDPAFGVGDVAGDGQHGGVVVRRLVEAGDQVIGAGPRGAGANAKAAGELGLAGRRQGRAFFVANPDPL